MPASLGELFGQSQSAPVETQSGPQSLGQLMGGAPAGPAQPQSLGQLLGHSGPGAQQVANFSLQAPIQQNADEAAKNIWNEYGALALQSHRAAIENYAATVMGMKPAQQNAVSAGTGAPGQVMPATYSPEQLRQAAAAYVRGTLAPERAQVIEQRARQSYLSNALGQAVTEQQAAANPAGAPPSVGRAHGVFNALERGTVNDLMLKPIRAGANATYDALQTDQPDAGLHGAQGNPSQIDLMRGATNRVLDPAIEGIEKQYAPSDVARANPYGAQAIAENLVEAAPSMVALKNIAPAAEGAAAIPAATRAASFALAGMQGGQQAYDRAFADAKAQGVSDLEARRAADAAAAAGGVTNALAMRFGGLGQKPAAGASGLARLLKGGKGGLAQAAAGAGQRLIGEGVNAAVTGAPASAENVVGGVPSDFLIGAATHGVHSAISGEQTAPRPQRSLLADIRARQAATVESGKPAPAVASRPTPEAQAKPAEVATESQPKEQQFSADHVLGEINKANTGQLDEEATRQLVGGDPYVLRDVPIEKVGKVRGAQGINAERVKEYAKMDAANQPPIVMDTKGRPIDGKHRLVAAQARGDQTIRAYVPQAWADEHMPAERAEAETTPAAENTDEAALANLARSQELKLGGGQEAFDKAAANPTLIEQGVQKGQEEAGQSNVRQLFGARKGTVAIPTLDIGTDATGQTGFQRRTLGSAIHEQAAKWAKGIRDSIEHVNRVLGTGLMQGTPEKEFTNRLRENLGQLEQSKVRAEHAVKPFRDEMDRWSLERRTQWANAIEQGQPTLEKEMAPVEKLVLERNRKLKDRAAKVGIDTSNWNPEGQEWVGRMAEWPDSKGHWSTTSMGGAAHFLKGRRIETFADFEKAVKETGGRLTYPNTLDMILAKQNEVEKFVSAKEFLRDEQKTGAVRRVAPGQEVPEGLKKIDDRIASDRGGQYAVNPLISEVLNDGHVPPQQRIDLFQKLRDEGAGAKIPTPLVDRIKARLDAKVAAGQITEGQKFGLLNKLNDKPLVKLEPRGPKPASFQEGGDLQSIQGKVDMAKRFSNFPEGHHLLDPILAEHADSGQLYAQAGIADKLNQLIVPGPPSHSVWDAIIKTKRAAVSVNFATGIYHLPTETFGNAMIHMGMIPHNIVHGHVGLALQNLGRAFNPIGQTMKGDKLIQHYTDPAKYPHLAPVVQKLVNANFDFKRDSILDRDSFEKAKAAYENGNVAEGRARTLHGLAKWSSDIIMKGFVPRMKAAAVMDMIETEMAHGGDVNSKEFAAKVAKAVDVTDHVLGDVNRINQFQHKAVQAVEDAIFAAPKFSEGSARLFGGAAVDVAKGLRDIAQGKRPEFTPRIYTALGYFMARATFNAIGQMAWTTLTTGHPIMPTGKDFFAMRTGKKNDDGTEERYEFPDPVSFVPSMISEGPTKAILNRVAPIWRAVDDVIHNRDYRNVQVREGGPVKQIAQSAEHIAGSVTPFSVSNALNQQGGRPLSVGERVAQGLGMRHAPSSMSQDPAERAAEDLIHARGGELRTQEQDQHSQLLRKLRDERHSGSPDAQADIQKALSEGKISGRDLHEINKKSREEPGRLGGLIDRVDARDLVESVWPKMTAEQKQQYRLQVRGKIGRSNLSRDEKEALWKQTD